MSQISNILANSKLKKNKLCSIVLIMLLVLALPTNMSRKRIYIRYDYGLLRGPTSSTHALAKTNTRASQWSLLVCFILSVWILV